MPLRNLQLVLLVCLLPLAFIACEEAPTDNPFANPPSTALSGKTSGNAGAGNVSPVSVAGSPTNTGVPQGNAPDSTGGTNETGDNNSGSSTADTPSTTAGAFTLRRSLAFGVPANTLFYASATTVDTVWERLSRHAIWKAWKSAENEKIRTTVEQMVTGFLDQANEGAEAKLGLSVTEVLGLFAGEFSVAFIDFDPSGPAKAAELAKPYQPSQAEWDAYWQAVEKGDDPESPKPRPIPAEIRAQIEFLSLPRFVVSIGFKEGKASVDKLINTLMKDEGVPAEAIKKHTLRGVEISTLKVKEDGPGLRWAFANNVLCISLHNEDLVDAVQGIKGGNRDDSLVANPAFRACAERAAGNPDALVFLNFAAAFARYGAMIPSDMAVNLDKFGLRDLRGIAGSRARRWPSGVSSRSASSAPSSSSTR